jgi:citrate synthase
MVKNIPTYAHPMMVVQAMIPLLELDESLSFEEADEHCVLGLQVIAKYPALICAISQSRGGLGNTALYSEEQVYLERFLTMFTGQRPTSRALEIFKTTQSLQIDHSFNAGTFASRVISSTLASVPSVLAGGAGALSGRLHGGADEAALLFAREVDTPGNAQLCVDEVLKNKGRIMGMGHREYRTIDPRAKILKPMAIELCKGSCFENDLETLMAIEAVFNARMAEKGKEVWANVDFYKGVTYEALGIGPDYFTTIFSMSRSVGWLAHFMESRVNNKIIRPAADYVGSLVSSA